MAFFGKTPSSIWISSLDDLPILSDEISGLAVELRSMTTDLSRQHPGNSDLAELNELADTWILDRRDPSWRQDGGFEGILALIDTARARCEQALELWETSLGPPLGAYGYVHENPYHLVAGSYLAAIGCAAGAWQLLRALRAEAELTSWTLLND
jgi:hypothetical protein